MTGPGIVPVKKDIIFCDLGHDPVKIQLDRTGKVVYCPECGTGYRYQ